MGYRVCAQGYCGMCAVTVRMYTRRPGPAGPARLGEGGGADLQARTTTALLGLLCAGLT